MKVYDDGKGQLSFDNMDAEPLEIRYGGIEGLQAKIDNAYRALRLAADMSEKYYGEKLIVCYSGGKDSDVCLRLAEECLGNNFEVLNSHTTVDAPETVKYIEKVFKRCEEKGIKTIYKNRYPVEHTMWELIEKKHMPPTRIVRYCCSVLKETGTAGRFAVLGVREAESVNRRGREIFGVRGGTKQTGLFFT